MRKDELVKRPVRYDDTTGLWFDSDGERLMEMGPFLTDEQGEHIALALNEYPDQAARISELEAENERLRSEVEWLLSSD